MQNYITSFFIIKKKFSTQFYEISRIDGEILHAYIYAWEMY